MVERLDGTSADAEPRDDAERIEAIAFRPSTTRTLAYVAPVLVVVGLAIFPLVAFGTPIGRRLLEERGAGFFGGWAVMILIIVGSAMLALAILRAISSGTRRLRRVDTLRLAVADAASAAAGAVGGTVLTSASLDDVMRVLAFAFVLTFLFTWAMVLPLTRRSWDQASARTTDS